MTPFTEAVPTFLSHIKRELNDSNQTTLTGRCTYPADFSGFKGHYPGQPVLPAIIQLITVRLLVEKAYQLKLYPLSFTKTKFRDMVNPEQAVLLSVTIQKDIQAGTSTRQLEGKFKMKTEREKTICEGHCTFQTVQ